MRYAIQKSRKFGYMPPFERKWYQKPKIRYCEADSIEDARNINIKKHGFNWNYTVIKPVFEVGDYIGGFDNFCYLVKSISDKMITICNPITNIEYTDYVDYERWHLLRKYDDEDIIKYPIGSKWKCSKESELVTNQDIVIITDYALSKGVFWASCEHNKFCKFIVEAHDLYK